jgi:palmitoyltransferase
MAPYTAGSQKPAARDNAQAHDDPPARDNMSSMEMRVGLATSVVMPLLELGAIGFVTWVLCYLVCFQYLIKGTQPGVQPRRSTGIAIIVVYAILLLLFLIPWMRLLQVIWAKPDVLRHADPTAEKSDADSQAMEQYDAYICDYEGAPLFCDKCRIYKPDRTHHCKELGRCVRKMDHYCPWAGGIIAETSHKYFMQFLVSAALYTTFLWIVMAIFLADRISKVRTFRTNVRNTVADLVTDWRATGTMDRSACRGSTLLYIYILHVLYDWLQSCDQLHVGRSDSAGWCVEHRVPDYENAKRTDATTANTTYILQ